MNILSSCAIGRACSLSIQEKRGSTTETCTADGKSDTKVQGAKTCSFESMRVHAKVLDTVVWLWNLYGFNDTGYSLARSIRFHTRVCGDLDWLKYWKWQLAAFFSFSKGQEAPKRPFPDENLTSIGIDPATFTGSRLLLGRGARFCTALLRGSVESPAGVDSDVFIASFLQSTLMLKKGLERPNSRHLKKSLLETFQMLTSVNPLTRQRSIMSVYEVDNEYRGAGFKVHSMTFGDRYRAVCSKLISEIFPVSDSLTEEVADVERGVHPGIPSANANYVVGQNSAGTLGLLLELSELLKTEDVSNLFSPYIRGRVHRFFSTFGWEVADWQSYICDQVPWTDHGSDDWIVPEDPIPLLTLEESFAKGIDDLAEDLSYVVQELAQNERPAVKLVALAEALKVRVISKGPPLTYYRLKPLQKLLHGYLRRYPMFRYIGEPISEKTIRETFTKLKDGEKFLSGDYKDATNNMHPYIASVTVDLLCDRLALSDDLRKLFHKAMTGHWIENPYQRSAKPAVIQEWVDALGVHDRTELESHLARLNLLKPGAFQQNGQLMGSVVSFIILCLVNATVCLISKLEGSGTDFKAVRFSSVRLQVNGDDFVMAGSPEVYRLWRRVAAMTGMEESVGKTFFSDQFLNMNSREFLVEKTGRLADGWTVRLKEVPFVNLGLMEGMKRSSGIQDLGVRGVERGLHDEGPLHHRCIELLKTAPSFLRGRLYDRFLNKNLHVLRKVRLPWFVPQTFGGIGLPWLRRNGSIVTFEENGALAESVTIEGERVAYEEYVEEFHKFGQVTTYPSYDNLCQMRYMIRHSETENVGPLSEPTFFKLNQVVSRILPSRRFVKLQERVKPVTATPRLNFLTFLAASTRGFWPELASYTGELVDFDGIDQKEDYRRAAFLLRLRGNESTWSRVMVGARKERVTPFPRLEPMGPVENWSGKL